MQIRGKLAEMEIEILQAPFGKPEPIGLLFEQPNNSILFDDFTWVKINDLIGQLDQKKTFFISDNSNIAWNGTTFTVKKDAQEMSAEMDADMFKHFVMLLFYRSIDPY